MSPIWWTLVALSGALLGYLLPELWHSALQLRTPVAGNRRSWLVVLALVGLLLLWWRPDAVTLVWVVLALAVLAALQRLRRSQAGRRQRALVRAQVREACDVIASELEAGQLPLQALTAAALVWPELRVAVRKADLGGEVVAELKSLARKPGAEGLHHLAQAWDLSLRQGAGLAAAAQATQILLADQAELHRVVAAETASAQATARSVAILPFFGLGLAMSAGADPLAFLLHHPVGLGCLAFGLGLLYAGLAWIDRLVANVEGEVG